MARVRRYRLGYHRAAGLGDPAEHHRAEPLRQWRRRAVRAQRQHRAADRAEHRLLDRQGSPRPRHRHRSAVTRVCRWGFEDLGLPVITWSANVGNEASRAVASKAGFQMEGTLRLRSLSQGALRDCWVGSLLPHELRDIR
ncbi:GNAT family N-acetyltransferase [Streptomyces sp. NPDC093225]|uniref:GNAT family N-acetyltransferase n=1 Tax=Streptomyces sp. NPDC093225 TaxID=3366034 RepID=UPI00380D32B8